ncbi:MAG TPA: FMN-binding domain-containing protein [Lachnospiraceae bacterium]|nr:FMN-binding domain-containing protein [Lachnospiraceae bacterium]
MKDFWIKLVSVLIVGGILLNYNHVLEARQKDEQILELTAELESARAHIETKAEDQQDAGGILLMQDGIYEGEAQGFGGTVKVEVSIEEGNIKDVQVVEAEGEDNAYLSMAKDLIPEILEAQSAEVDLVSGATFSSTAIREATAQALEKAVQSNE